MKLASILLLLLVAAPAAAQTPPQPQPQPPPTDPPAPADGDDELGASPNDPAGGDDGDDVDALRQEYLKLRDELFQSRARAAAVASAVFSSKVTIQLAYTAGRFYAVDRASIRLDGASVYDDTEGAITEDDATRFEGWIAPGRHVVAIRVEATGKDDQRFSSATEATFVVEAVAGKDLLITARAKDGGDIPYEWSRGEHGSYQLLISADVKAVARAGGTAKAATAATKSKTKAVAKKKSKSKAKAKAHQKGSRRVAGSR